MQVQQSAALLRWGVDNGTLPQEWAPPLDLDPYVGCKRTAKTITTPLELKHILELVDGIPDPRWRFSFQLLAAYGLRPEELQHLEIRGDRLWCEYRKSTSPARPSPGPCVCFSVTTGLRAGTLCELPPKVAAAAMGHSVETHLASYSTWCGDDVVDNAFERAAKRLDR